MWAALQGQGLVKLLSGESRASHDTASVSVELNRCPTCCNQYLCRGVLTVVVSVDPVLPSFKACESKLRVLTTSAQMRMLVNSKCRLSAYF